MGPDRSQSQNDAPGASHENRNEHILDDGRESDENTPLLSRQDGADEERANNGVISRHSSAASSLLRSMQGNDKSKGSRVRRWPSILALSFLCAVLIVILIAGFFTPEIAKEYASEAARFQPQCLSIASFTDSGVIARIEGDISIDASLVQRKPVRDLGRFGTWIARKAESGRTLVEISLPEYGDLLLGTAVVPPILIDLRNGHSTPVDFLAVVEPGEKEVLRRVASDWLDGRLGRVRIKGEADVPIKSGLLSLGEQSIAQDILIEGDELPSIPQYQIKKLDLQERTVHGEEGIAAEVSVSVENEYPVDLIIPPLGFDIAVDNCDTGDPLITIASATTHEVHVEPRSNVILNATGFVRKLPKEFLTTCPDSQDSPLDAFVGKYIHGKNTQVYVQGSQSPSTETPQWLTDLAYGVSVPVAVPGRTFGHLIKNFTMEDVRFSLPDFFAEPGTPEAQPKISAKVTTLIALPEEMNFPVGVHRIKSTADLYYKKKKLGNLDLYKWNPATSRQITAPHETHPDLEVTSTVTKAPLTITNDDLFNELVQALLLGNEKILLSIKADVDVEMETAPGTFAVHRIPAEGEVPVKPIGGDSGDHGFGSFNPQVGDLKIVDTDATSMTLGAMVNLTNPTKYSTDIPYADINILCNQTVIGHATVHNMSIHEGNNINIRVSVVWEPSKVNGTSGSAVGRELLSQYLSGYNTTLTMRPHEGTIPAQPNLGRALASLQIDVPFPHLGDPGNGTESPHLIEDTTMHILSSTANFVLNSPFKQTTMTITSLNATAFYKGNDVGRILYDKPLSVPPGRSETPDLPVDWSVGGVGFGAIKEALGGSLKLSAFALVGVKIGEWREHIWYEGRGIGAKIRI